MTTTSPPATLRLGLIGDNIARSRSPRLHELTGRHRGVTTTYDRLVPRDLGLPFDEVFAQAAAKGYRGINVTYPYKEVAARLVIVDDPLVRAIGAVNTVLFEAGGPKGFNTDFSGFEAAYRARRGDAATGPVCMIGTGGVGRAVAFGLLGLGVRDLRLVDRDAGKAEALAGDLRRAGDAEIGVHADAGEAARGAAGLINCTPVGMVGHDGTPLPRAAMAGAGWAFDAVYTPVDTQFLTDAAAEELTVISGYELFFWQGVHASRLFTGAAPDEARLRADLASEDAG